MGFALHSPKSTERDGSHTYLRIKSLADGKDGASIMGTSVEIGALLLCASEYKIVYSCCGKERESSSDAGSAAVQSSCRTAVRTGLNPSPCVIHFPTGAPNSTSKEGWDRRIAETASSSFTQKSVHTRAHA